MATPADNNDASSIDYDRLHRTHAAPTGGNSLDVGGARWRPTGTASMEQHRKVAHRLALCWNVMEGIPTEAIEEGVLDRLQRVSWEIVDAQRAGQPLEPLVSKLGELLGTFERRMDRTEGRLSDCPCAMKSASPEAQEDAPPRRPAPRTRSPR